MTTEKTLKGGSSIHWFGRREQTKIFWAEGYWYTPDGSDGWVEFYPDRPDWAWSMPRGYGEHVEHGVKVAITDISPDLDRGYWDGHGATLEEAIADVLLCDAENEREPRTLDGLERVCLSADD